MKEDSRNDRYLILHIVLAYSVIDLMFHAVTLAAGSSTIYLCDDEVPLTGQVCAPVDRPLLCH